MSQILYSFRPWGAGFSFLPLSTLYSTKEASFKVSGEEDHQAGLQSRGGPSECPSPAFLSDGGGASCSCLTLPKLQAAVDLPPPCEKVQGDHSRGRAGLRGPTPPLCPAELPFGPLAVVLSLR